MADGKVSRRGLLRCMAAGAGAVWTVSGGVPRLLGSDDGAAQAASRDFTFVQISDSHIGFKLDSNPDPGGSLRLALARIAGLPAQPAMILHTGDVSHLSKPEEFDLADQIMRGAQLPVHYVPGEHDVINDDGKSFHQRFGAEATADGWYSFDQGGVHFVALVNVLNLKPGGLGSLGTDQLAWLATDLKSRGTSTPIVVFTHMPLWSVYPQWGWGTDDGEAALAELKRFGSVTILNGHIHQVIQKVEGRVSFQTAMSTAFPQPSPGSGPGPGPLKVPAEKLKSLLGIRAIDYAPMQRRISLHDTTLES